METIHYAVQPSRPKSPPPKEPDKKKKKTERPQSRLADPGLFGGLFGKASKKRRTPPDDPDDSTVPETRALTLYDDEQQLSIDTAPQDGTMTLEFDTDGETERQMQSEYDLLLEGQAWKNDDTN